jgi:hypothetical protein
MSRSAELTITRQLMCLLALPALAACLASGGRDDGGSLGLTGRARTATSWGTYIVELRSIPTAIEVGRPFTLEVRVAPDNAGDDLGIMVDAGMPEHAHGMNLVPRDRRMTDGTFSVEGMLFHMPGAWEIYVDVTRAGETERATFDVMVDG